MATELEKQLYEALKRLLKWAGPISGDNHNHTEAREEDESATQAYSAITEYERQLEQEQNSVNY